MALLASSDHVARGLNKLLSQFADKPKVRAVLATYLRQLQVAEDLARDTVAVLSINSGTGIVLDRIGVIIGRGRRGLADDDYRFALRAQIRINRSCGIQEDFIAVLMLSVNNDPAYTVECRDAGPACAEVILHGPAPATVIQVLWESVRQVKMCGVRLEFVVSTYDDNNTFACAPAPVGASSRGPSSATKGFGWSGDATLGGHFAMEYASS